MQELDLLQHNKDAYLSVLDYFKTHDRACIVHATGSGKSFVITALARHFKRVLVIAPNKFVLNETKKLYDESNESSVCEFVTYASLMYKKTFKRYDLIVIDEFHRAGAEKWGAGVQRLLDANKNAKIFGTSATHIRYLDNERNMADEIFDGSVVSKLTLRDAIDRKILPNPTYVSSLYTLEETIKKAAKTIEASTKATNEEKRDGLRHLKGIMKSWNQSHGVARIIHKYISHDTKRIIIFCSNIKRATDARKIAERWFTDAGFTNLRFYNIDYKERLLEQEMYDFEREDDDVTKIAISVNMLNEGIHVPHVDAVIMMRSTISRIIIEQQIGRCLTTNNRDKTPVVLDLVNNMESVDCIHGYTFDNKEAHDAMSEDDDEDSFPFTITDEMRDIRVFMTQIDKQFATHYTEWSYQMCKEIADKYTSLKKFRHEQAKAYDYIISHKYYELIEHMERCFSKYTFEECVDIVKSCETWKDFFTQHANIYHYAQYKKWLLELKKYTKTGRGAPLTKEECIERIAQCKSYSELSQKYAHVIKRCSRMGWQDLHAHLERKTIIYDEAKCVEIISHCRTFGRFKNKYHGAYNYVIGHNLTDKLCSHMKGYNSSPYESWTRERILEVFSKCKSLKEFHTTYPAAANAARRHGMGEELRSITPPKKHLAYSYDECIELAKSCGNYTDFVRRYRSAYGAMCKNGWKTDVQALFQ